jgi:alpha-tubulin suppressor-like RCC1 family protein
VGGDSDWDSVWESNYHNLAIKGNHSLWAWGANWSGQLGLGNAEDQSAPVPVVGDGGWAAASGGGEHTLAIRADGSLWAWGYNFYGQLGIGDSTDWDIPTPVGDGWRVPAAK